MPPQQKKFVKYQFDDPGPKPREQNRQSRQSFKQRDSNTQTRNKRHVSYTEKSQLAKQNVLRDMINSFIPIKKASAKMSQLMKKFPKFFSQATHQPQPFTPQCLNVYLAFMGKKIQQRQARHYTPIQHQSEQDPNWDSDTDVDGKIESKKIDEAVFEKVKERLTSVRQLRQDELKRHQKQFLEDYYRQKHQQELQNNQKNATQEQQPNSTNSLPNSTQQPINQWTQYQQKQVTEFVNMGFIEKIQQDENDFSGDDFSVEDEKSQQEKSEKSSSSDEDDDIFGDEGPRRIVKVKAETDGDNEVLQQRMGKVVINNHLFSRIAQMVGIPPGACIWIIRNKTQRYKVSTQFMDEMYRLNNFCESLPYVSLNHSQFVHNHDVEKQKGLEIFKKFNARKHQTSHSQGNSQNKIGNRNYQNNKRKFQQYKPNPQQPTPKTHINKK